MSKMLPNSSKKSPQNETDKFITLSYHSEPKVAVKTSHFIYMLSPVLE